MGVVSPLGNEQDPLIHAHLLIHEISEIWKTWINSLVLIRGFWVHVTEIDGEILYLAFAPFIYPIQRGKDRRNAFCFYFYCGVHRY